MGGQLASSVILSIYSWMQDVLFSIIIPTYNRAELILGALESLSLQNFRSFEVIVVDDGGTDDTQQVIASLNLVNVRYIRQENRERGAARNTGIRNSSGVYVSFMDSDDMQLPFSLSHAYEQLKQLDWPECYAQAYEHLDMGSGKVTSSQQRVNSGLINQKMVTGNFLSCIGVFVKRAVFDAGIGFDEERRFSGSEDWLLWLKLAARYPFWYSDRICARMRHHSDRSVLSFPEENLRFRTEFIRAELEDDAQFVERFGISAVKAIYAHMLGYTSLHLAMSGKTKSSIRYLYRVLASDPRLALNRRTLATLKIVILQLLRNSFHRILWH